MNIYQKIIYKTAKAVCRNQKGKDIYKHNLINCYKARLQESKKNKRSIKHIKWVYRKEQKWNRWFDKFKWEWDEENGHAIWVNKITGELARNDDWNNI